MVQKNSIINKNNKILIICGATATGKTNLAIECAKLLNSEVISADSMYIYNGLDIGTAKPTASEMQGIKHHLIDIVSPFDSFTVSDYKNLATPIIDELISQGKVPVICGGTGFYINSILYDLSYGNGNADPKVREYYNELAKINGNEFVYNILCEKDIDTAKKLHYNDIKRVIRALEICETGIKKSEIIDSFTPKYNYDAYSISFSRDELYSRINSRVDIMFNNGLVDEVRKILDMGVNISNQCLQGIGYKETIDYINGNKTLEETIELIKLNTRHYAKRQITYFKRLVGLKIIENSDASLLAERIVNLL